MPNCDATLWLTGMFLPAICGCLCAGRWHILAKAGLVKKAVQERWQFMVGSEFTRFRHGLRPFKRYELRTDLAHVADHKVRGCSSGGGSGGSSSLLS